MFNNPKQKWIFIAAFLLAAGGFLVPFWPLEILGILVGSWAGSGLIAVALGLLLDLAYGTPTGITHYLFFPFTLLATVALLARYIGARFLFERSRHDTLLP